MTFSGNRKIKSLRLMRDSVQQLRMDFVFQLKGAGTMLEILRRLCTVRTPTFSAGKMKTCRKLKDYPQVPGTPPPGEKRDRTLLLLEEDLNHERKYLYALSMENKELEEILQDLDGEIAYVKGNFPQQIVGDGKLHANNEFWFKYESQMEVIRKLEREKKCLESDIRQIEEQGMINLDSLSQSELIMYVKQLERTKTHLLSDLRSKEWGLDKQARDIHHLNEMKRALQAEIRHYDKEFSLFRYKKKPSPSTVATDKGSSAASSEKKFKFWNRKEKNKNEEPKRVPDKQSSLSQENLTVVPKSDIMFSSLDESKLGTMDYESPTPSFRRRTIKGGMSERKRVTDLKRGAVKKTVTIGPLPELSKVKSKSPSPRTSKSNRMRPENKVGTSSPAPNSASHNSNKPIKIIVTYETQKTTYGGNNMEEDQASDQERKTSETDRLESYRSLDGTYEDDFEESDEDRNLGFLTTRV